MAKTFRVWSGNGPSKRGLYCSGSISCSFDNGLCCNYVEVVVSNYNGNCVVTKVWEVDVFKVLMMGTYVVESVWLGVVEIEVVDCECSVYFKFFLWVSERTYFEVDGLCLKTLGVVETFDEDLF